MDGHRMWPTPIAHFFRSSIWDKRQPDPIHIYYNHVCRASINANATPWS